jgi:SulP family sulfate permease
LRSRTQLLSLNRIEGTHLRGDLAGGVTAGIVALPLALAFGVASGAGPIAGLYGAICVGFFAALFGGTSTQISGPTGPMTIVAASLFTQFGDKPAVAFTVVMMTGGFQILFGMLKVGRYINLMPYPVISGFMTGIGGILIIMQLDPMMGFESPTSVINALTVLPEYLSHPNWGAVVIGGVALLVCLRTPPAIGRIVPAPLIALTVGSLAGYFLLDVPVLGEIPSALPSVVVPSIDAALLKDMLTTALVLAALGSIDSLLTSLVADNATASFHDSDKELVGQGIGNLVAGLLGGIPGAGATIRTLTNIQAGGRTALSGAIHALVLLVIVAGLGPMVSFVPHAALAGVLIKVGIDVIDWQFLRRAHRVPRVDLVLMVVVFLLTVFVDVITAVGIGIVLASLTFVKQAADVQMESIRSVSDPDSEVLFNADEAELFKAVRGSVQYVHLAGLMSFGAANEMARRFGALGGYEVLILDLTDLPGIDGSAGLELEELIARAVSSGQEVIIIGLRYSVARALTQLGSLELVRESQRFGTRREGLEAARRIVEARGGAVTPPGQTTHERR